MRRAVVRAFLDAGHAIAVLRTDDQYHDAARLWSEVVQRDRWQLVTTTAVLAEIGNAFARQWQRVQSFLQAALANSSLEIVSVSAELVGRALELRNQRLDKEWGLTDCISFVVMHERGLRDALAADRHFEQAGFRALLRESPPERATQR